jgi:hypothetical protein
MFTSKELFEAGRKCIPGHTDSVDAITSYVNNRISQLEAALDRAAQELNRIRGIYGDQSPGFGAAEALAEIRRLRGVSDE